MAVDRLALKTTDTLHMPDISVSSAYSSGALAQRATNMITITYLIMTKVMVEMTEDQRPLQNTGSRSCAENKVLIEKHGLYF